MFYSLLEYLMIYPRNNKFYKSPFNLLANKVYEREEPHTSIFCFSCIIRMEAKHKKKKHFFSTILVIKVFDYTTRHQ